MAERELTQNLYKCYSGVRITPAVCRVKATQDAEVSIIGNEGGTANSTSSLSRGGVFLFFHMLNELLEH